MTQPSLPTARRRRLTTRSRFLRLPTTRGLERLGQKFSITDTSPLDPKIKISATIGAATGLELLGHGRILAAGERHRRGGGAAGVIHAGH